MNSCLYFKKYVCLESSNYIPYSFNSCPFSTPHSLTLPKHVYVNYASYNSEIKNAYDPKSKVRSHVPFGKEEPWLDPKILGFS